MKVNDLVTTIQR